MASANESTEREDQTVPNGDEDGENVRGIQSRYLRCPSPSFSAASDSRFSLISGSDAESFFMEPIHLSSAVAAKKIISQELPPRGPRAESIPESMLETADQLMVEDLYNRVKDMMDDRSPYNTPCVLDIQRAMVQDRLEAPINAVDEVWPGIFIAEKSVAVNKARLKRMGITHVLNAAHGTGVYTGESFYAAMNIRYLGIEVDDFAHVDISPHFRPTSEFLDEALLTHKGKVLVVSMMGVSRAAVLVASYLMIFQHMSIMEALTTIRKKRAVNPNEGFLKQLRDLNEALMEERDDDDDTLSQCSVIDARTRARIFGEDEDEDEDTEEERSMISVKAQSIMMEEEEDAASVMSSVASSAAAAALRGGATTALRGGATAASDGPAERLLLPEQDDEVEDEDDEDGLSSMIREWRRRNEVYQSDEWWEEQLNSDADDAESNGARGPGDADLDSVTSEEIQATKERTKPRVRRRPPSEAGSASSCNSYSDLWKQRLKEIEEQAAARYRGNSNGEGSAVEEEEVATKKMDAEVESLLSDSSSMYNFCQKNKDNMTPLERWRVKRIQFGWNKKDREDGENSSVADGDGGGEGEAKTPPLRDVNLTAYQAWKLRQQKRHGEENTDDILQMSRGEDSAAVRRRQRREEVLERAKKNLEESQSMCGWDNESAVSAVPLSAFWAGAGVADDDKASMLSGRSSVISSVSQPRGTRQAAPPNPATPVPPILPAPTALGPNGEPMVDLASIQNWIANVVSETIMQKQTEMSLPPPSRAGSEVSFGAVLPGRDNDKVSTLGGSAFTSGLAQGRGPASVLGGGASSVVSGLSGRGSALGSTTGSALGSTTGSALGSTLTSRKKITTTSVPLFSLFQDQVNLKQLDAMDKDIKSEMRDKMAVYEKKKILEDNKRSTLYKKKKPREDEDEDQDKKDKAQEFLQEPRKRKDKTRSYGLSGHLMLNPALERDKNTTVDDWLKSVRPPPRKPLSGAEDEDDPYDDLDASASEFDFSSYRGDEEEEAFVAPGRLASEDRFPLRAGSSYGGRPDAADDDDDDVATFLAQTRERARARAAAEAQDDEVLAAWRTQQDAKHTGTGT